MYRSIKKSTIILVILLGLFFVPKSYAHFLWLNVDDYTPNPGQQISITLGWGHKFPETPNPPREEMIKKLNLFLINPNGNKTKLKISVKDGKPQPVKVKLLKKGVYFIVLTGKYFVSKTTEGYFLKAKDELKDKEVIYSKWSETTAIALISVGKQKEISISSIPGSNFYIIPLVNPSILKKGDIFQVKVLFKDKPCRTWVYATYAGFSKFKDTYAWTTRTDIKGVANIGILKKGVPWLIRSDLEKDYPNHHKADMANYKCTITFGF